VRVMIWKSVESPGGIEDEGKFLIAPTAFDYLGIVKTEFVKANGGTREKSSDKSEILFVEFTIALDFGTSCLRPTGTILAAVVEFAREE